MRLVALATACVLAAPTLARAEPPGLTPVNTTSEAEASASVEVPSYRLQTAAVDAGAIGLALLGAKANALGAGALATYMLGAPLVHIYHHQYARAAASLGLRVGLPVLGAMVGNGLGRNACSYNCDNDSDIAGAAFGALVGAVLASAIDIGYVSRGDSVPAAGPPPVTPTYSVGSAQVSLGIGGTF